MALLPVQVAPDEEEILKTCIWDLADNKIFFQHPDLMKALNIRETVIKLMMNTLNKAQHQTAVASDAATKSRTSGEMEEEEIDCAQDNSADMVVACCRFLCYFCRTGSANQKALFFHLGYLLENSRMLLARPSL